jgi:hypothetical protein
MSSLKSLMKQMKLVETVDKHPEKNTQKITDSNEWTDEKQALLEAGYLKTKDGTLVKWTPYKRGNNETK